MFQSTIVKDLNKNYFTKKEAVLKQAVTKLLVGFS